jgi:hypothetical protein
VRPGVVAGVREQSEKEGAMRRIIRRALIGAAVGGLVLAGTALAFTLYTFRGKTSQGYAIHVNMYAPFLVKHKLHPAQISVIQYHSNFTGSSPLCAKDYKDAVTTIRPDYPATIRLPHDKLAVSRIRILKRPDDYVHNLRGQLKDKTITGSFTEKFTTTAGATCTTGKITFTVKR